MLAHWKARLAARKLLLAAARKRHIAHPTAETRARLDLRKAQVHEAETKVARYSRITMISTVGVKLIKEFEGFPNKGRPYRDPVGIWTIGYGHIEGVTANSKQLTEPQAFALLERDLDKKYCPYVAALKLPLTQNQFDALVSFVYNVGPGGIGASTGVGRALRAHSWRAAADHLLDWDKAGGRVLAGLTRRRKAERALFLK